MTSVADAARYFLSGPQVPEAARLLLSSHSLVALCEALSSAPAADFEPLVETLECLANFQEVHAELLKPDIVRFLLEGSGSPAARIRRLVARVLMGLSCTEASVEGLARAGLFDACERLLLDEETDTAETAMQALRGAVSFPAGRDFVLGGDANLVTRLRQNAQTVGDVQRIRILALGVELGRASAEAFTALETAGAFKDVLDAFITDDILLKLNAVELMEALGSYPAGQKFVSQQGVPERLARELTDPLNDDSVRLCVTQLLGRVLLRTPDLASTLLSGRDTPLAQAVASALDSRDVAFRLCGLNTWADISTSPGGLAFFLQWPTVIEKVVAYVSSATHETCMGATAAWTSVLRPLQPEGAVWDVAEKEVLPVALRNIVNKPFSDVRAQTWLLLSVLVKSRRAAQVILVSDAMRENMMDFSSETNHHAKIAKHEFITSLTKWHAGWIGAFLDDKVELLLQEYAKQGPNWQPFDAVPIVGKGTG
uniref:26S proteasome non-ATPase regulatory subunit 5 n=1 Tax=Noctiluca scintillans TaxID=2966 RepID=A0A7S1ALY8_NOCSC|mmetsp:Transcript_51567/g.137627  ORF Transcript_51567/g.137627 Transcript_51567/m.137627 type:complete len:484 (+) Transcript_51567:71-1522(+)|eukprot:CAMPEP_0194516564 /NCGR_PEP_ID=MMETSP0253-20130528/49469_1 /TAXON_ID=2966 /ORGANISM="Noctiluca scintillans" /LENGTH=483 /DNA_ID=CAMNT_0039360427 /DNA_START=14 /DNA_END=1465 /DNA_ORIENTATION=-